MFNANFRPHWICFWMYVPLNICRNFWIYCDWFNWQIVSFYNYFMASSALFFLFLYLEKRKINNAKKKIQRNTHKNIQTTNLHTENSICLTVDLVRTRAREDNNKIWKLGEKSVERKLANIASRSQHFRRNWNDGIQFGN